MKENKGRLYEQLIAAVYREAYGDFDEEDPDQHDEYCQMLDYWSEDQSVPGIYDPGRAGWIVAAAAEWLDR